MGFDFSFRQIDTRKDLKILVDFLMKQALGYPNYENWVQRSEYELDIGYKHAILAFSNGHLVGNLVYQPHKELPRIIEYKNLRVHPEVRNRSFARFMLKQPEAEYRGQCDAVLADTRTDLPEMIAILRSEGYVPLVRSPLYDPNVEDLTMIKCLNKTSEYRTLDISKRFIQNISL